MPDPSPTIPTPPPIPDRVVLGANGAYWRDFSDGFYSMCPNSTDNDPVEPVAVYVLAARLEAAERDREALRDLDAFASNKAGYWQHPLTEKARRVLAEVTAALAAAQQPPDENPDG
jgi:hypothetical protein